MLGLNISSVQHETNSAVIILTSLLFNKTVNGFNSIIENKNDISIDVIFLKLNYII